MTTFRAEWVFTPEGWKHNQILTVEAGTFVSIADGTDADTDLGTVAVLPGFVNAHSHAFQYGMRGACHDAKHFDDWVGRLLYPYIENLPPADVQAVSLACFREMARSGITTVGEFHYVHNDVDGTRLGSELDRLIIEAAREAGIRIGFLRTLYDTPGRPGRRRFLESPQEAEDAYRATYDAWSSDPHVTVMTAPHSTHGAGSEMIRTAVALSEEFDLPMHIHLCERVEEIQECEEEHGVRPMKLLDDLGAVNERMVAIHCVHLNDAEVEQLGRETLGQVSCPSTNLLLGDGISPLTGVIAAGGDVSLGSDANQRLDMIEEGRLAENLQRIKQYSMNELGQVGSLFPNLLHHMTAAGAKHLAFNAGTLETGKLADFIAIPLDRLNVTEDGHPSLEEILMSRTAMELVHEVYVGGNRIVRND
jgi:formiminoglutamate deiminase